MNVDMCVPCDNGVLNIRSGAIIMKDGKVLMAKDEKNDYYFSIGGRLKFGETAEEAVVREVFEETGIRLTIDKLGFIHENYFIGDQYNKLNKLVYEISFFFYMNVPNDFEPISYSYTDGDNKVTLSWISLDDDTKIYPEFYKKELKNPQNYIKHFITDGR